MNNASDDSVRVIDVKACAVLRIAAVSVALALISDCDSLSICEPSVKDYNVVDLNFAVAVCIAPYRIAEPQLS